MGIGSKSMRCALGWGLLLAAAPACSLLPVTKAVALPPPERFDPGPGERRQHNADGQVVAIEQYWVDEQGKTWRHGKEWEYWPDGTLRSEREFAWGEPSGVWRTHWRDGALRSDHTLEEGVSTPMVYFHPNGQRASEGLAQRGRREGPWTYWYADGTVGSSGSYWQGERHGPWREFHPDGSWKSYGHYDRGDKVGSWWYGYAGQHTGSEPPAPRPSE